MMKGVCGLCKHSLEDNAHGFDQDDGYMDERGKFVHSGFCKYCVVCTPALKWWKERKNA